MIILLILIGGTYEKTYNDKNNIVEEVVQGMIKAFPDKVSRVENEPIIIRKNKKS